MAELGNNPDAFLNGLSDFWLRFFRDIDDLRTLYQGTAIEFGQVYLNLLNTVLNTNVVEAPLFRKEYYHQVVVREDQLVYRDTGLVGTSRYVYTSDNLYGAIPLLQNKVFTPSASLEQNTDYGVAGYEIQFAADPTDPVLDGYASRQLEVAIGGLVTSATDWAAAGVEKGDTLYLSELLELGGVSPPLPDARKFTIVHVTSTTLALSADTPLPTFPSNLVPAGFSWRVVRERTDGTTFEIGDSLFVAQLDYTNVLKVNEISFWAIDAEFDEKTLYKNFGAYLTREQNSTESYRALIRGLMQLYVFGPAIDRMESALNVAAGFNLVREDDEVLQGYDSGLYDSGTDGQMQAANVFASPTAAFDTSNIGGLLTILNPGYAGNNGSFRITEVISATSIRLTPNNIGFTPEGPLTWELSNTGAQTVTTDQNEYTYSRTVRLRDDVKDPGNYGTLTFRAFEALTAAIRVVDYIKDPTWWHSIVIPQDILPEHSTERRVVNTTALTNEIGTSQMVYIGDPGYYIGANEYGDVITGKGFRHYATFILMDRFLKAHMFGVLVDAGSLALTSLVINDLLDILRKTKPIHTYLYFQPGTVLLDTVTVSDVLTARGILRLLEEMPIHANEYTIGSSWVIGEMWQFSGLTDGAYTIGATSDFIPVVIGGMDPSVADPVTPSIIDRPLYVYAHP